MSLYLSWESWAIFKRQEDKFKDFLLHGRTKELAASGSNRRPEVGWELLRILMLQDQLRHTSLSETSGGASSTSSTFSFQ